MHRTNDIASIGADVCILLSVVLWCRIFGRGGPTVGGRGDTIRRITVPNDVSRYRAGRGPPLGPAECITGPSFRDRSKLRCSYFGPTQLQHAGSVDGVYDALVLVVVLPAPQHHRGLFPG